MKCLLGEWIGITAVLLALCLPAPLAACDGTPPSLVNKDTRPYTYSLTCGKKAEEGQIPAGETRSLEGKSGCVLELEGNKATKLHTEMVCTIEGGLLGCSLL